MRYCQASGLNKLVVSFRLHVKRIIFFVLGLAVAVIYSREKNHSARWFFAKNIIIIRLARCRCGVFTVHLLPNEATKPSSIRNILVYRFTDGKKVGDWRDLRHSSDLAANRETILCSCSGWQVIRCFRSICTIVTFTTGFQGCVVPATWESSGLSAQSTVIMWYRPAPVTCVCNGFSALDY